jgi:peptidoglycan/LPS O-acetylase OafA/YrhL
MDSNLSLKLDALGGYSALAVLFAHVKQWFVPPVTGIETTNRYVWNAISYYAVLAFFVISGYVITHSLLENRRKNGQINKASFLRSRALRILPPFIAALSFSILVATGIQHYSLHGATGFRTPADFYVARHNVTLNPRDVWATAFLSNGVIPGTGTIVTNGALWPLSYEVWLYGFALLVAIACEPKQRSRWISIAALAVVALLLRKNQMFFEYAIYWAYGAALALYLHAKARWRFFPLFVGLVALPGLFVCAVSPQRILPLNHGALSLPINLFAVTLMTALFRLQQNWNLGPIDRLGAFLSRSSYTLYILHFPILLLLFSFFHLRFLGWSTAERSCFLGAGTLFIVVISSLLARVLENRTLWNSALLFMENSLKDRSSPDSKRMFPPKDLSKRGKPQPGPHLIRKLHYSA